MDILQGGSVPGYQLPHVVALCLGEADQGRGHFTLGNTSDPLVCKVLVTQLMLRDM